MNIIYDEKSGIIVVNDCTGGFDIIDSAELDALYAERDTLKKEIDTLKKEIDTLKKEIDTLQKKNDKYSVDTLDLDKSCKGVCADLPEATLLRERNRAEELEAKKLNDMTNRNMGVAIGIFMTRKGLDAIKEGYALAGEYYCLFNKWYAFMMDNGKLDELEERYWSNLSKK